jgi:hypothetical protein
MIASSYFNADKWGELIQDPLWYMGELYDEYSALMQQADEDKAHRDEIKSSVRSYFADRLERGMVALAETGEDLDAERQPIDTIVVHHTSGPASVYNLPYLNAVHLLRIYLPPYREGKNHKGQPLWSGHFYKEQQVFWGYHWFIREDGVALRILPDEAIGWHAGNWEVNTRSIAICFAGNFMQQPPNSAMLAAARTIIQDNYNGSGTRIVGHREVRDTTCPGDTFSDWKGLLQEAAGR